MPQVCNTDPAFLLNTAIPQGGTYSGKGVHDNYFYPTDFADTETVKIRYQATGESGCTRSDTGSISVLNCRILSTDNENFTRLNGQSIFPNPVAPQQNIQIVDPNEVDRIVIHSMAGIPVLQTYFENGKAIPIDLPRGVYMVNLYANNKLIRNEKLIVQ